MSVEAKYFTDEELISIENFCNAGHIYDHSKRKLVIDIMEFLNTKGYLSAKQKNTVLGVTKNFSPRIDWSKT